MGERLGGEIGNKKKLSMNEKEESGRKELSG